MTNTLGAGLYDVPAGMIATVVTHLEMTSAPVVSKQPPPESISLNAVSRSDLGAYRQLFAHVGAEWLWFSRLIMADEKLLAILQNPKKFFWAVEQNGAPEGLLELNFSEEGVCVLEFFGLAQPLIGRGIGRWLMAEAVKRAWRAPITRFTVHTCTLDHPSALGFYQRSGFRPVRQEIEIAPDPRLYNILDARYARHVPLFPKT